MIGGPTAIHQDVIDELENLDIDGNGGTWNLVVNRVAGADRYETAAAVALRWGVGSPSWVGTLDGQRTALLTQSSGSLGTETRLWLEDRCPDIQMVRALGGTAAVSSSVLGQAVAAAQSCDPNP